MGEAKRRKKEIERLKGLSPEEAQRLVRVKEDESLLERAITVDNPDPRILAALVRRLHDGFEAAKLGEPIDVAIGYLNAKIETSVSGFREVKAACKKGCSHCCHTWVSVTAPQAIYVSKIVRSRGEAVIAKVRAAHAATKSFDSDTRTRHPTACPLLEGHACTIYDHRPSSCRFAASTNADICARSYWNVTDEKIPMPIPYWQVRGAYSIALLVALKQAGLPYASYELNAALVRALDTVDIERRWLAGDDVFAGVLRQPPDTDLEPHMKQVAALAFQ